MVDELTVALRVTGWIFTREAWHGAVTLGATVKPEELDAAGVVFTVELCGRPSRVVLRPDNREP